MPTAQLTPALLLLAALVTLFGCERRDEGLEEVLRNQLARRFPDQEILPEGEFAFSEAQDIEELAADPVVASLLPEYRFFKTQLTTSYEEYPYVDVIAAISAQDHADVRILVSPTFTPDSPEFLELFYGLRVDDADERRRLAESIARMFASITFQGSLESMETGTDRFVFNLYRQGISQNILIFEFDDSGQLIAIRVMKGAGTN